MKVVYGVEIPDDLYTYEELSEICGFTSQYVCTLCKRMGINSVQELKTKEGKKFMLFGENAKQKLQEYMQYFSARRKRKPVEVKKQKTQVDKESVLARLRKAHPLVKDDRFFDINYWPDLTLHIAEV